MTVELCLFKFTLTCLDVERQNYPEITTCPPPKICFYPAPQRSIFLSLLPGMFGNKRVLCLFILQSACFLLSGYLPKQRLLTEVPLTFSIVKSRSFTCPKMLLQIFQDQTLVFRWSAFPMSQAMYHWQYRPSNLTKFWTSQNGSQKL